MNILALRETITMLGFTEGSVAETIMVTMKPEDKMNAAPMGVIRNGDFFEVKPFKSSQTCRNLHKKGEAVINVTCNPWLFYATAFKDEVQEQTTIYEDGVIEGVDLAIHVVVETESDFSDLQALFQLKPVNLCIKNRYPTVFSRGRAAAIEAVIHATRIKVFHAEGNDDLVNELLEKVEDCIQTVKRVSWRGSEEAKVIESLQVLMKQWGVKA